MREHSPAGGRPLIRLALLGMLGVALAALVVVHSGTAFLGSRNPAMALAINADEPVALIAVAEAALEEALRATRKPVGGQAGPQPPAGPAEMLEFARALAPGTQAAKAIESAAKHALVAAPLDARPLRLLAYLADSVGDTTQKRKLLEAAVRRSKNEPLATYWLMLEALRQADEKALVQYADLMLSKHSTFDQLVVPLLALDAENPAGAPELQARLLRHPDWRGRFFRELTSSIKDARTPLNLLVMLKGTPFPPTAQEVGTYLEFAMNQRLYDIAYYAWLQFLPPEKLASIKIVNNGDFESEPGRGPFEWTIPSSSGSIVEIGTPLGEAGKALHVSFVGQGRVELQPVEQMLVLAPGRYTLSLRQKGELSGRRGVQWTVTCVDGQARIGELPMFLGSVSEWQPVEGQFVVPADGCRAQALRLGLAARTPSEQIVKGSAWFDDLNITRAASE